MSRAHGPRQGWVVIVDHAHVLRDFDVASLCEV
jgi:hypothetical protein